MVDTRTNITIHSKDIFLSTMANYSINTANIGPIYRYFIMGFPPGGFFTSVLANDFANAMIRCDQHTHIESLKNLVHWLHSRPMYGIAWGDYEIVNKWSRLNGNKRRKHLEAFGLIYPEKEEIILALKNAPFRCEAYHNLY